jgi:hypothetical protein
MRICTLFMVALQVALGGCAIAPAPDVRRATAMVTKPIYRPCPEEKDLPPAPIYGFTQTDSNGPPEAESAAIVLDGEAAKKDSRLLRAAIHRCNQKIQEEN